MSSDFSVVVLKGGFLGGFGLFVFFCVTQHLPPFGQTPWRSTSSQRKTKKTATQVPLHLSSGGISSKGSGGGGFRTYAGVVGFTVDFDNSVVDSVLSTNFTVVVFIGFAVVEASVVVATVVFDVEFCYREKTNFRLFIFDNVCLYSSNG